MRAKRILVERARRMHIVRRSLRVLLLLRKKNVVRRTGALARKDRSKFRHASVFRLRLLELSFSSEFRNQKRVTVVDKYLDSPDIDPIENVDQENKRGRRESGDR